jgi:hypothetical protein
MVPPEYGACAGRYDNPIPTQFLAPTDCSKIPAQEFRAAVFMPSSQTRSRTSAIYEVINVCVVTHVRDNFYTTFF